MSWLLQRLPGRQKSATPDAAPPPEVHQNTAVPQRKVQTLYPPQDPGLPLSSVQHILDGNTELLDRIKLHAATDTARYARRYQKPIERLAEHINALPATPSSLFSGEGGLFRASLELAFLSFQASDGRIFTGAESVERRHKLEPRWRYICFAAALLFPIGKPLGRMVVISDRGEAWPKHQYSLSAWAEKAGVERVYLSWPDVNGESSQENIGPSPYSASVLHKIIGPENLAWLEEGTPELTRTLFELISGGETSAKTARELIGTMWLKVKQREDARRPQNYGRLTIGTHLPPHLIGAMRSLVEAGRWKPNEVPFMVDGTGIYLVWPKAGEDIVQEGLRQGQEGWPSSAAVLGEILKSAGFFDASRGNDVGMTEIVDAEGNLHPAFKLKNPNAVYEEYEASNFTRQAPKTLAGVLELDPLAKAEKGHAKAKREKPPATATEDSKNRSTEVDQATGEILEVSDNEEPATDAQITSRASDVGEEFPPQDEASDSQISAGDTSASMPSGGLTGKIKEGPEIKFSDLVPEDIKRELRTAVTVEILGKVIKAWRERGENSATMRMTDNGAAFNYEFLTTLMRNTPDWINEIAAAGLVYSPPSTPGLKVPKVAIPEGSKPREAVVISRFGCKKLGL